MEGGLDDSAAALRFKDPFFTGPAQVLSVNEVYDPATNKWETRKPMSVPRNHAFAAAVNGKIYVIGGRTGHAFILTATNTDVVEEYDPLVGHVECSQGADAHRSKRRRARAPTAAESTWPAVKSRPRQLVGAFRGDRGVRPADQFVEHAALDADAASRRRGCGDRQSPFTW